MAILFITFLFVTFQVFIVRLYLFLRELLNFNESGFFKNIYKILWILIPIYVSFSLNYQMAKSGVTEIEKKEFNTKRIIMKLQNKYGHSNIYVLIGKVLTY